MILLKTLSLLILGFAFLWKGGDFLVSGTSTIGKRFNIPSIILGLTLVSFGTSGPELIVSLIASFNKQPDIIMGNIIGSNIANTFLILGIAGIIFPIAYTKKTIQTELFINVACALFLCAAVLFFPTTFYVITTKEGFVCLGLFCLYLFRIFTLKQDHDSSEKKDASVSMKKAMLLFSGGCILLPLGGQWVVSSAIEIGALLHLSDTFMSLFAVALGTSLPELSATTMAAYKKETELALGNIIGSNIFNILLIIGVSASIHAIPVQRMLELDLLIMLFSSLLILGFFFMNKTPRFSKGQCYLFLSFYMLYMSFIFVRA